MNTINKFNATMSSSAVKAETTVKAATTAAVAETSLAKAESLVDATPKQMQGLSELDARVVRINRDSH